jgi:putative Mg2+ transporter-C (MgtC) family protein
MEAGEFFLSIGAALLMGMAIGLERQWRQHTAGLRTNTLVCLGAALFVSLARLMHDQNSPTRMASYVVSGIGFLGGGVILREGLNVRGMNTAATLWCTAAVGVLSGSGFPAHALLGAATILSAHLGLRPLARWVDTHTRHAADAELLYRVRVVCQQPQEALIRTILQRHINAHASLVIQGIATQDADNDGKAVVVAEVFSLGRNDKAMEALMSRINIEPSVTSVRWERLP